MSADSFPAAQLAHPTIDAQYEILHEVGRGGTAVVYLARERETGADVAIKLIRAKYLEDEEAIARFAREARLVAQLDHPNVVPVRAVLDLGSSGIAIVMAHLNGRTLKQVIKHEGALSPPRAERIFRDIASALASAHAMGIVHRDVKPENIFIEDDGRAVLADFGLARTMSSDTQLTMVGVAIGTPAYMAPEQIDGTDLDGRADIYSLGLVAWEMLSGRRPWDGASLYAILYHQKHETLPDVRDIRDDVPDSLAEGIARAVEKDREDRWSTAADLLEALDDSPAVRVPTAGEHVDGHTLRFTRPPTPSGPATWITQVEKLAAKLEPGSEDGIDSSAASARRYGTLGRALIGLGAVAVVAFAASALRGKFATGSTATPTPPAGPVVPADSPKTVLMGGPQSAPSDPHISIRDSLRMMQVPKTRPQTTSLPVTEVTASRVDTANDIANRKLPIFRNFSLDRVLGNDKPANPISVPSGPPPLVARPTIAAGGTHSCLINGAGRILCWGANDRNQLGNTSGRLLVPLSADSDAPFATMSSGMWHSCAVARDGSAWCWGENEHGQLGDRSRDNRVVAVRVADAHIFRGIAAGGAHTCGLDAFGIAWCWGANNRGQLGDSTTRESASPVRSASGSTRFSSIAAGWNFTCALATNGRASCWGENSKGQLGDGTTTDRLAPVPIGSNVTFTYISAGNSHACGVTGDGIAYCWGLNSNGQLGDGTNADHVMPVRVRTDVRFTSITTGALHTCAVAENGNAYCWGRNNYGQLGTGQTTDEQQPALVADGHVFAAVRAFGSHTCGVTVSAEPYCWGYNLDRQLGDGTRTQRSRPVRIETPGGG
jgi:alpha-tubulin suppressor-like RCC1 family protein/tRNA A-37 threonylcarbamoyl transferase component Bud32